MKYRNNLLPHGSYIMNLQDEKSELTKGQVNIIADKLDQVISEKDLAVDEGARLKKQIAHLRAECTVLRDRIERIKAGGNQ